MSALLFGAGVGLGVLAIRVRRVEPGIYLGENSIAATRRGRRGLAIPAGATASLRILANETRTDVLALPPIPVPTTTPTRETSSWDRSIPLSLTAWSAAAKAN